MEQKMTDRKKLKPCPFCGGEAFVFSRQPLFGKEYIYAAICLECCASSKRVRTPGEAIEAWERRADDDRP